MALENSYRQVEASTPLTREDIFVGQPEKLNILWANESSVVSGPVNKLSHTVPLLVAAGHNVTVLVPSENEATTGSFPEAVAVAKTRCLPLKNFNLSILYPAIRAKKLLRGGNFDIVHVATPMRGPFGLFFLGGSVIDAAYDLDMPLVAGAQTFNKPTAESLAPNLIKPLLRPVLGKFVSRQESRMHGKADVNYSPSEAMDEYILERDIPVNNIVRLQNGIDPMFNPKRRHTPEAIEQRKSWGIGKDETVLLVPGRLAVEKSLDRLKDVADIPRTKIVLVGDGPERKKLEDLLPEAIFTGMLKGEELANTYANGDILVLTSDTESYSQVLFEGWASGLPVITPSKGAFVKLVEDGITGLKYNNVEEFRHAIIQLTNSPKLRARMAGEGRTLTRGRTWEEETRKLLDIYRLAIYLHKQSSAKSSLIPAACAALNLEQAPGSPQPANL